MKALAIIIILALAACSSAPVEFSKPPRNAPVWDLNVGSVEGANAIIHPAESN